MGSPVESEVKVRCDNASRLVDTHPELGWVVVSPRHFEDNHVFELPADALRNRGSILRLRVAEGRATLTYKALIPESATSAIKVREELETIVADYETMVAILERLGMKRTFRYQKYRTVYRLSVGDGDVFAMSDETPFGEFLEIEGDESLVTDVAARLGFSPASFIRESYIGIQAALCAARGVPLQDLVFEDVSE